jgi:hypothetical protein
MESSLSGKGWTKFVLPGREMCSLSFARAGLRISNRGLCGLLQRHAARTALIDDHATESTSEPNSPARKPTDTRRYSSAATPSRVFDAHEVPPRRSLRQTTPRHRDQFATPYSLPLHTHREQPQPGACTNYGDQLRIQRTGDVPRLTSHDSTNSPPRDEAP